MINYSKKNPNPKTKTNGPSQFSSDDGQDYYLQIIFKKQRPFISYIHIHNFSSLFFFFLFLISGHPETTTAASPAKPSPHERRDTEKSHKSRAIEPNRYRKVGCFDRPKVAGFFQRQFTPQQRQCHRNQRKHTTAERSGAISHITFE